MVALQVAPARSQAGKELLANGVQGLVIRGRAGLQGQVLQLMLLGDLQLPEGVALLQPQATQGGKEQSQVDPAQAYDLTDCPGCIQVKPARRRRRACSGPSRVPLISQAARRIRIFSRLTLLPGRL